MSRAAANIKKVCCSLFLLSLLGISIGDAFAQAGPFLSFTWDYFPYQNFEDPAEGLEDVEVAVHRLNATLSWPIVFAEGRTVLANTLSYELLDTDYRNWPDTLNGEPEGEPEINLLYAAEYTLMLQHRLSQGWSLLALATPGLVSDLKGEISLDDFNLQTAVIFIRHFSERFSLGLGGAYSTQFGEALPLPVLSFEWNNGANLRARGVVPSNLEFWYQPERRIDVGMRMSVDGNEYHGDPEIFEVDDPRARYSTLTFGPSLKVHLSGRVQLHVEGGIVGVHRSDFYDGDTEVATYNLGTGPFLRTGMRFSR
jgi:hypothetical protein